MGHKFELFPNEKWNIEVTKPQVNVTNLDSVIEQLQKHIKKAKQSKFVLYNSGKEVLSY